MNKKHTPGPWLSLSMGNTRVYHQIIGSDNAHIADTVSNVKNECSEANALLIAAAPDLLKALRDLVEDVKGMAGGSDPFTMEDANYLVADALKIISKATGQ